MTKMRFSALAGVFVLFGAVGGYLTASSMQDPMATVGRVRPMWAHNYHSLGEMVADADAIVLATVSGTRPGRVVATSGGLGALPFTLIDLSVDRVIRGEVGEVVTVEQTGGQVGDVSYYMEHDGGSYAAGSQALLFLKQQPDTGLYYVAHPMGRFQVNDDIVQAVLPDQPVAQALDLRPLNEAVGLIHRAR